MHCISGVLAYSGSYLTVLKISSSKAIGFKVSKIYLEPLPPIKVYICNWLWLAVNVITQWGDSPIFHLFEGADLFIKTISSIFPERRLNAS